MACSQPNLAICALVLTALLACGRESNVHAGRDILPTYAEVRGLPLCDDIGFFANQGHGQNGLPKPEPIGDAYPFVSFNWQPRTASDSISFTGIDAVQVSLIPHCAFDAMDFDNCPPIAATAYAIELRATHLSRPSNLDIEEPATLLPGETFVIEYEDGIGSDHVAPLQAYGDLQSPDGPVCAVIINPQISLAVVSVPTP